MAGDTRTHRKDGVCGMKLPTQEQENSIKAFWTKAKSNGWKYVSLDRVEEDDSLVILMLDSSKNKHYLRVSPDGEQVFLPVTMVGAF